MICYIEVPFIANDLLYRSALYSHMICYLEVPFIANDLLYRSALHRQ